MQNPTPQEWLQIQGHELLRKVQELIEEGNVRRITVKGADGHTIAEFPLTLGIVGAALAPMLAAIGAIAALVTQCSIAVEREA